MTRKEKWLIAAFILLMLSILFSIPIRAGEQKEEFITEQIVLMVDHSANGEIIVVPKGTTILSLVPVNEDDHYAPLSDGTIMICRAYRMVNPNGSNAIGWKCGFDRYRISGMSWMPPKK